MAGITDGEHRYSDDQPRDPDGKFASGDNDKSSIEKSWELKNPDDGLHGPQKDWVEQGLAHVETVPVKNINTTEIPGPKRVKQYIDDLKNGSTFPLIEGYKDNTGAIWLSEGHHRLEAWKSLGHSKIPMVITN